MKTKYTHLLFDLDHTLWDFDANCKLTLSELFNEYKLDQLTIDLALFVKHFIILNNEFWSKYDQNLITKEVLRVERFRKLLSVFNVIDHDLAAELEIQYLNRCPKKGLLMPSALEIIDLTKPTFEIYLITNGFQTTQEEKVNHSELKGHFKKMYTSESTGFKKPDPAYFNHVIQDLNIQKEKCLVIGDNPNTDIKGASNAGIHSLWVNSQKFSKNIKSNYYVENLGAALQLFA